MKRATVGVAVGLMVGFGTAQPAIGQWAPGVAVGGTYGNLSGSSAVSSSARYITPARPAARRSRERSP